MPNRQHYNRQLQQQGQQYEQELHLLLLYPELPPSRFLYMFFKTATQIFFSSQKMQENLRFSQNLPTNDIFYFHQLGLKSSTSKIRFRILHLKRSAPIFLIGAKQSREASILLMQELGNKENWTFYLLKVSTCP